MSKTDKKYFCVKIAYKDYEYKIETKYSDKVLKDYLIYETEEDFDEENSIKDALEDYLKEEFSYDEAEAEVLRTFYEKYQEIFDKVSEQISDKGDIITLKSIAESITDEVSDTLPMYELFPEEETEDTYGEKLDEILENQKLILAKLDKQERDFEDFEYKFEGIEKAIENIKKILEAVESIPDGDYIREVIEELDVIVPPPSENKTVGEAKKIIFDLVSQLAAGTDEYIKTIKKNK